MTIHGINIIASCTLEITCAAILALYTVECPLPYLMRFLGVYMYVCLVEETWEQDRRISPQSQKSIISRRYGYQVPVDSVLLIEAQVDEIEGRKLWMSASVRDQLNGKEFVQSRALFVSPKWYSFITTFVKNTFKST
eukprot:TRINITY_DN9272_c0_g1_i5.p3 TRINITY_DN9272_c0_g1~~TRINITY_DN9272_c0_g1_i5.p3  ORF type:complete len:137 (-),score=7.47 TRINITY_DN9272_c0_g1_i5:414-824(-)